MSATTSLPAWARAAIEAHTQQERESDERLRVARTRLRTAADQVARRTVRIVTGVSDGLVADAPVAICTRSDSWVILHVDLTLDAITFRVYCGAWERAFGEQWAPVDCHDDDGALACYLIDPLGGETIVHDPASPGVVLCTRFVLEDAPALGGGAGGAVG